MSTNRSESCPVSSHKRDTFFRSGLTTQRFTRRIWLNWNLNNYLKQRELRKLREGNNLPLCPWDSLKRNNYTFINNTTIEKDFINVPYKSLPMTEFKPRTTEVGSNRSTNWATTSGFSCFARIELSTYLLVWPHPNLPSRRSDIPTMIVPLTK